MKTAQDETATAGPATRNDRIERLFDSELYGCDGERLGKINAVWSDADGRPAFLGVRIPTLVGSTHVLPAGSLEFDENRTEVRAPYTWEQVRNAPAYDPHRDLNDDTEREVSSYYESMEAHPFGAETGGKTPRQTKRTRRAVRAREST